MEIPITTKFKANTLLKAFILNALATALIAAIAIEMRMQLNEVNSNAYFYANNLFGGKKMEESQKFITVFGVTFLVGLIVYHIMYWLFQFGGGMMVNDNIKLLYSHF